MRYHNLDELIQNSRSSRGYFISLPVKIQLYLHSYSSYITSAQKLHELADAAEKNMRMDAAGGWKTIIE